jgi:hypothetical protein
MGISYLLAFDICSKLMSQFVFSHTLNFSPFSSFYLLILLHEIKKVPA